MKVEEILVTQIDIGQRRELLREMKERGECDSDNGGDRKSPSTAMSVKPVTLKILGITHNQCSAAALARASEVFIKRRRQRQRIIL